MNDKSGGQSWWPLVVAVLGIFGISNMRGGGPPAGNPPGTSESTTRSVQGSLSSVQAAQEPAVQVVESFLLNQLPDLPPEEQSAFERCICQALQKLTGGEQDQQPREKAGPVTLEAPWQLQAMIVNVPNPIESAVSHQFDAAVESLQFAMSAGGFVLDRYRLPWFEFQDRLSVDPKLKVKYSERTYAKHPGALLFRGTDPCKKELVLMLLVGENPLSGVYKQAFSRAVQIILEDLPELHLQAPHLFSFDAPQDIPVLGPYFSGSADSLALSISQCKLCNEPLSFRVVSGSAMNVDKSEFVKRCRPAEASFHATVIRADLLKWSLIDFVHSHGWYNYLPSWLDPVPKIAWLTESNTGFGQVRQVSDDDRKMEEKGVVELPFPIHISRVRGSFSDAVQTAQQDVPNLQSSRLRLKIPFEDPQPARDVIPEFTSAMTATTAELLLNEIMTTIARGRFRYVGITATDARDRIFLAGLVRKVCPDVQLLIIESDLLFTHPESRSFMKGALIASSYAVTQQGRLGPEERTKPDGRHIEFPADYCQGVHNAAIILRHYDCFDFNFDSPQWASGPPGKLLAHELRGYETIWFPDPKMDQKHKCLPPDAVQQPGVWLSVVGNDELWPIQHSSIESLAERLFNLNATCVLSSRLTSSPECPPRTDDCSEPKSDQDAKKQDFRELLNYTFSTWPNRPKDSAGEPVPEDKLPNAERLNPRLRVRTHLNAFDRTLFCIVLFVGAYAVIQHSQKKSFWAQFRKQKRRNNVTLRAEQKTLLLLKKKGELSPQERAKLQEHERAIRLLSNIPRTAAAWFLLQSVAVLGLSAFATWLWAIRIHDEVNQFPTIDGWTWWWVPLAVVLFELAGDVWLSRYEGVCQWLPKWKSRAGQRDDDRVSPIFWLLVVLAVVCLMLFFSALVSINHTIRGTEQRTLNYFLLIADLAIFVLGCVVTAGIVRLLAWERLAATPPEWRNGIATLVAVIVALAPCWAGKEVLNQNAPYWVFFYERCAHSLNGVSLWSASLFLAAGFYLLAYQQQTGLLLDGEGLLPRSPWPDFSGKEKEDHPLIKNLTNQLMSSRDILRELLGQPYHRLRDKHSGSLWILGGVMLLWLAMLATKIAPWMYDCWFSVAYWIVLSVFFLVWVLWLYWIVTYLKELERFFDRITNLPILDSFKRLPDSLAPFFGRVLFRIHHLRTDDRRMAITYLNTLEQRQDSIGMAVAGLLDDPEMNWNTAFALEMTGKKKHAGRDALNAVAQMLWEKNLFAEWQKRSPDRAFAMSGTEGSEENTVSEESTVKSVAEVSNAQTYPQKIENLSLTNESKAGTVAKEPRLPTLALANDFILIQLISYCNPLLRHAWRSFYCVVGATLLFLLAVAAYAAQPQGFFGTTAVGMIIVLGVLTAILVWRTERSELLSRFSGTTPGKVQFDLAFVLQAFVLLLIPILVVINYAFPGAFDWLTAMLAPLFHVMK